jgi:hypothetical protein
MGSFFNVENAIVLAFVMKYLIWLPFYVYGILILGKINKFIKCKIGKSESKEVMEELGYK